MKKAILASAALAIAGIGLSGCGQEAAAPVETAPEGFPGVTVTDGRLVLPAVKGNPAAVYFDIAYEGDRVALIRAVSVQKSESALMHTTVEAQGQTFMEELLQVKLESGEPVKFERGGHHLMVEGLDETVAAGDTIEVTLTFLGGDKLSFPAEVLAAGDAR